jgi:hypothetical protein
MHHALAAMHSLNPLAQHNLSCHSAHRSGFTLWVVDDISLSMHVVAAAGALKQPGVAARARKDRQN